MLDLKYLRKNLDVLRKKFKDRNVEFDVDNFSSIDAINRDLIIKKEKLEHEKKILSKSKDQTNFIKSKKISEEILILTKKQTIRTNIFQFINTKTKQITKQINNYILLQYNNLILTSAVLCKQNTIIHYYSHFY